MGQPPPRADVGHLSGARRGFGRRCGPHAHQDDRCGKPGQENATLPENGVLWPDRDQRGITRRHPEGQ